MKNFLNKIKSTFAKEKVDTDEMEDEYVELETTSTAAPTKSKVVVQNFVVDDFSDIKPILDSLREGYTIAVVNIKPLKDKDLLELKRAIRKIKKTCDAIDGDIAGFGEDYIVATPAFAEIKRSVEKGKGGEIID